MAHLVAGFGASLLCLSVYLPMVRRIGKRALARSRIGGLIHGFSNRLCYLRQWVMFLAGLGQQFNEPWAVLHHLADGRGSLLEPVFAGIDRRGKPEARIVDALTDRQ